MSRKAHWEGIYKDKSPDEVSWYQKQPSISLAMIDGLSLQKNESIIDVGGGASTLVDCLFAKGFKNISVLDLSSNALLLAKHRIGKNADQVDWIEADVTGFVAQHQYSLWHDRAVFHFLTEKRDRDSYKKVLDNTVREAGYIIIAAFATGGPTKCSGLDIVQYDADKLQQELGAGYRLIDTRSEKHITPGNIEQLFGYYLFKKQTR